MIRGGVPQPERSGAAVQRGDIHAGFQCRRGRAAGPLPTCSGDREILRKSRKRRMVRGSGCRSIVLPDDERTTGLSTRSAHGIQAAWPQRLHWPATSSIELIRVFPNPLTRHTDTGAKTRLVGLHQRTVAKVATRCRPSRSDSSVAICERFDFRRPRASSGRLRGRSGLRCAELPDSVVVPPRPLTCG